MDMKKWIAPLALIAVLGAASLSGCASTDGGKGVQALEQMSELDYNKWKLYIQLGVKIGANRLLQEGTVSVQDLSIAATAIETVRDQTGVPGTKSFIQDALKDAGLTNDEVELLLVIVEQELLARGALDWLNPETGVVEWSPRTKDLLTLVAGSLRTATTAPQADEVRQGQQLEQQFNGKLISLNTSTEGTPSRA